ncbi:hypothetical protein [Streptomyces sp. NPDC052107]|uniref:hypothetical protein n=1 Tax=Streptomyces sp. NPDC052107 TaxID=3155632 RepID=UPI0034431B71
MDITAQRVRTVWTKRSRGGVAARRNAVPVGSVFTVRTAHDRDRVLLGADSSVGHRRLRRLSALPADCTCPAATDPRTAFAARSARARPSRRR